MDMPDTPLETDASSEAVETKTFPVHANAVCAPSVEPSAPPMQAGFVRRAVAFIMDCFLINILYAFLALFGVLGVSLSSEDFASLPIQDWAAPFLAAGIVLFISYFTFFHTMEGQTPAKKVLRIKVIKEDGRLLSVGAAFIRASLGYFLSSSFFGAGFFIALFGEKKRALHDFLMGSYVICSQK